MSVCHSGAHTGLVTTTNATGAPSPTTRTDVRRHPERASTERADLLAILEEAVVCHVGVLRSDPSGTAHPVVLPMALAVNPDGPDTGGTLYLHGSVAAGLLTTTREHEICVTVTHIDGLVLARSAFHHSMNYRSAVVIGRARPVVDDQEKRTALDLIVDHLVPGRSTTLRAHTRKELVATAVLALPLEEASVKRRTGGVSDDQNDIDAGVWAGVVPLRLAAAELQVDPDARGAAVPDDVRRRHRQLS